MYFLVDKRNKVVFGWSAKCGCSHIKKIFKYLQNGRLDNEVHVSQDEGKLPADMSEYTTILIIRNPYERIVSGFLDKYRPGFACRKKIPAEKQILFSFEKFVDYLVRYKWTYIDRHHFTPQTTEAFRPDRIHRSKVLRVFDLKSIDYAYIEGLYGKTIPPELLAYRGGPVARNPSHPVPFPMSKVFHLDMSLYLDYKVVAKQFYNPDIKAKVQAFYKEDLQYFDQLGFHYDMEV